MPVHVLAVSFWAVALWATLLALAFAAGWFAARVLHRRSADYKTESAFALLRETATSMAEGVGQHFSRMAEISSQLDAARATGDQSLGERIRLSVSDIVLANQRLQEQLATAERTLQQQAEEIEVHAAFARTDPLTGLFNRRGFDEEIQRRYAEWLRHGQTFSLLMIDLDEFKQVNDRHGHQGGDEVLRAVGVLVARTLREMDVVARYGGEEFAVILPSTRLRDAMRAAERLRLAVAGASFAAAGQTLCLTVSVGAAQVVSREGIAPMIAAADAALYAAKSAGRNRAFLHDGTECRAAEEAPAHV